MLESFPGTVAGWAGLLTIILVGVFALIGIFDKVRKQREEDANKVDDRLIKLLKDQIEALERRVTALDKELLETKTSLQTMQIENKTLRDVLQGRDGALQDYMKTGLSAMAEIHEVLKLTRENGKNIERLYKAIEKHLGKLEHNG